MSICPGIRARLHRSALHPPKPGGQVIQEAFTFAQWQHDRAARRYGTCCMTPLGGRGFS